MIQLCRNTHHANGENLPVLEIWKTDPGTDTGAVILVASIPLDKEDEEITVVMR